MEPFRDYLASLPDELLASVTADYVWLATLDFVSDSGHRRDCCREECIHRGLSRLYAQAEESIYRISA